ncbi:MAG: hypothetical protein ACJAYB_003480 [Psychromonas sp.]|jgi:hypothetical protein
MAVHVEQFDKRDLCHLEIFCDIYEQGGSVMRWSVRG